MHSGMTLLKKLRSALLLRCCTGVALTIALTGCSRSGSTISAASPEQKDSISLWIQQAKDTSGAAKIALLEKACRHIYQLPDDSLKLKHLTALSYEYLESTDSVTFRKVNREAMLLAVKAKDSSALADTYWDLGDYLSNKLNKADSGFYCYIKAQQLYEKLENSFSS
ncbi:MAG: hypothetical protein KDD04_09260, partial [Sinomicrobium sp.]|nr:hypothetical protein [Sinomicrobium sp.]